MPIRPSIPIKTTAKLDPLLKEAGERFRSGDTSGSLSMTERAWDSIPDPKYEWDFYPEIIVRHMIALAVADRDEPRLRRWIEELYGVYRDPERGQSFTVTIEAEALRDIGLTEESATLLAKFGPASTRTGGKETPSKTRDLDDATYSQVEELSSKGDDATENDDFQAARRAYGEALALLPEPQADWSAWTWIQSAIGDTYFFENDWPACRDAFREAVAGPDGLGNPLIHLRLGQCALELGEQDQAKDELMRAFMADGSAIFDEEDPKYLAFLKSFAKLD